MPVSWEQIGKALKNKNADDLIYGPERALDTLKQNGDIFAEVLYLKQNLSVAQKKESLKKAGEPVETASDLERYAKKRDFKLTAEPAPGSGQKGGREFVIQKHAARRLHYDLRLEAGGVLKSWAVPKGPSSDPSQKRLAVMTEDHPYDYKDFEGTIPAGQYGGGTVIVWDNGTYENVTADGKKGIMPVEKAIEKGKLEVRFDGKKLKGIYAFVRMKGDQKQDNWLLIKKKDEFTGSLPEDLETIGRSVISGKSIKDIERENS
jgi:bifunctional non-homologous end joining protein LigD